MSIVRNKYFFPYINDFDTLISGHFCACKGRSPLLGSPAATPAPAPENLPLGQQPGNSDCARDYPDLAMSRAATKKTLGATGGDGK
ncbi:MAG: hypothetical protein WBA89_16070 [Microcoleus sp.]|uniref:hypothetical protein n=1 Tax=Microcoleus sp. TaxID=44472 RepID=UPI003C7587D9